MTPIDRIISARNAILAARARYDVAANVDAAYAAATATGRACSAKARAALLDLMMRLDAASERDATVRCLLAA